MLLFASVGLWAQSRVNGAVSGVILDPSGAAIPAAHITAINTQTGAAVVGQSNATGAFQFLSLQPGNYTISVGAKGFSTQKRNAVVYVGQTTPVNFKLAVGSASQTVTVTGEQVPVLQTQNANIATTLSTAQLSQIPVPGNDINSLLQLAPGAVMTSDLFPSFYGLPTNSNLLISNGMEDIDPAGNSTNGGASNLLLGLNEVKETTVSATSYGGEFGYLAGSNDTIVTKSGTNQFHGDAKFYWNQTGLNANNFFNNTTSPATPRSTDSAKQWAASLGGPIIKNKLFFFVDEEGIRLHLPTSQLVIIPSQQFEAATIENLTRLGLTSSIPFYCQKLTLTDAAGNSVTCPAGPSSATGLGQGIFNLYNTSLGASRATVGNGNPADPTGCNGFTGLGAGVPCALNYRSIASNYNPEAIETARVDWNASANNRVWVHFKFDDGTQASFTDPINPIFNSASHQPVEYLQTGWTWSPGDWVNEFHASLEHFHVVFSPPNLPATLAVFPTQLVFG
ncbi:MAG: carboxypeptidase regulatory-like domain-containing protein, partial [Terriglobales bacterium]